VSGSRIQPEGWIFVLYGAYPEILSS